MSKLNYLNNKQKKDTFRILLINKIKDLYTPENSFLVTAKKIPNSDSSIITASCQFVIRRTETTRPKKTSYI